ncbi:hypothetical protein ACFL3D_03945 [Candidatus Omnitrophota bacterium]
MKRRNKFFRIFFTMLVFALAAYAFSIIWSPENIARFFNKRGITTSYIADVNASFKKGPQPSIHFDAVQHIVDRHIDQKTFTEKSKFTEDVDITELIDITYARCDDMRQEEDKYVYEYDSDTIVGTKGQTAIRLVTADDGSVITMYPIFELQEARKQAA